jgi:hypothetical protein
MFNHNFPYSFVKAKRPSMKYRSKEVTLKMYCKRIRINSDKTL